MLDSTPSTPTSTAAIQRRLIIGILMAALVALAIVVVDLAIGGRPDAPALRGAATLLDGAWRFHTGDDPRWANADADDGAWETIDLTAAPGSHDGDVGLPDYVGGWAAHGHAGYDGYAWYRRAVSVPPGRASWVILGPTLVEDGYELYWNGHLLGGSGRLGAVPRVVGTRPLRFALPADAAGTRGVLAIRTFMLPRSSPGADNGGIHSAPMLAPRTIGDQLHHGQWQRTIAGYIVEVVEPVAMFAVICLAFAWRSRSTRPGFLLFASLALALMAVRRLLNAVVAWTDLLDLPAYAWLTSVLWLPTLAAWAFAWNRWCTRAWPVVDVFAVVLAIAGFIAGMAHAAGVTTGTRLGWIALFVVVGVRIARGGSMRVLALLTLASIVAAYFGGELLDPLGVPGIWFPFGIGVSRTQYIYAIAIPLVAVLIARTMQWGNHGVIAVKS